jgi:muramoyltetrapeptide carboxypeptidase
VDLGAEVVAVEERGARERPLGPSRVEAERVDAGVAEGDGDAVHSRVHVVAEGAAHPARGSLERAAENPTGARLDPAEEGRGEAAHPLAADQSARRTAVHAHDVPGTGQQVKERCGYGRDIREAVLVVPPALRPGDLIAVVAPSGPLPRDDFWRGLAWLRDRYRIRMTSHVLERSGFLAGDDERRIAELVSALDAPGVGAVVAGRGGYGAMRLLSRVGLSRLAAAPRWLVGFSDITALHVEAARSGVASVHAPNVTGLGRTSPANRGAWLAAVERPHDGAVWPGLVAVRGGVARGRLYGGNLALLEAMAAAGRLEVPAGSVLVIEDVDERPYRIDRMLTSLRLGGHLSRVAAVVVGGFTRCPTGPDGVTPLMVLEERLGDLGVPVVAGAPFGHGDDNRAFVLGREAEVDGGSSAEVRLLPLR